LLGLVSSDVAILERSGDALALIDDWEGRDAVGECQASCRSHFVTIVVYPAPPV
jgi:hypothetical protein